MRFLFSTRQARAAIKVFVAVAFWPGAPAFAQAVRTWVTAPSTGIWNTPTNWNPADVPDAPPEAARFGVSAVTDVTLVGDVFISHLEFDASATPYVIHTAGRLFYLQEGGVINASALRHEINVNGGTLGIFEGDAANTRITLAGAGRATFNNAASAADADIVVASTPGLGGLTFFDSATAGRATILNQGGIQFIGASSAGSSVITNNGGLSFFNTATAGQATISGEGSIQFVHQSTAASANIISGGNLTFFNTATAGTATILNQGQIQFQSSSTAGSANITNADEITFFHTSTAGSATITTNTGALTSFINNSNGGNARLVLASGGLVTFAQNIGPAVSAGSIEGNGQIALGSNNLTVGSNNLSTEFAGFMTGTGGLTKTGTGTLTLSGNNSHSGTLITGGVLAVSRDANLGTPGRELSFDGGTLRLLGSFSSSFRPGTLGVSGGTIDTNGFNLDFGRPITGAGGLTKTGAGTLTLRGANTYQGGTLVLGGKLAIEGVVSGDVQVGHVGIIAPNIPTVGGSGTIGGDLFNFSGVVAPGSSPGRLQVGGNYIQLPQGTLEIEIAGRDPSQYDRLEVGGQARLDGTVRFITLGNFRPRGGDRFVFLTAAGGVNGRFSTVELDRPLLAGRVVYTGTTAELTFSRRAILPVLAAAAQGEGAEPAVPALTPNQTAVAQTLDRALDDSRLEGVFGQLDRLSLAGLPGALDRIAPEELSAMYEVAIGTANVQAFNLDRHLGDVRAGARGFSGDRLSLAGYGDKDLRAPDGKKDVFTPTPDNRWSTFVAGAGEFTSIAGDGNAPGGYDLATGGFTLGATYRVSDGFALGAFTGYAGTSADLVDDGRLRVHSGKLGVYGTLYGDAWYVNAMAAGGLTSFDTKRQSLGGHARGDTDGGEFSALLSGGYNFHFGALTAGPVAEAGYTWSGYHGFRESGSAAPLDVRGNESDSLRSRLGARVAWNLARVRPELRLLWQHEWADNTRPVDAAFASGAGRDFRVEGPRQGRDALVVNASVSFLLTERTAAYLAYDAVVARERYGSHSVTGGVRVAF